uniref:30S ribosomal protein 3, chloroplastic n=1 Tax=Cryptomonas sp. CCAC 1634B TaxID=2051848 RepID=A0A679CB36_9CRYP|nr:plastid-specific 30S ribosomal protein 3 [Cryptomonas sp. CCAC 1634B]
MHSRPVNTAIDRDLNSPHFALRILWLQNNIGVAVDLVKQKQISPLTCYYFWPRNDAWEQLKTELESTACVPHTESAQILKAAATLIDLWQENHEAQSLANAQLQFPNLTIVANY